MPGVDWLGQTGAASRLAPVGARLGTGVRRQRSRQARRPSRPPLPSPTPAAGAHARRRPGRNCGTGRRSGRWVVPAGTWVTRGDVTTAGRAGVGELAAVCPTSPIVPRGVASRPPPPPRVPPRCNSKGVRVARARSNRSPAGAWKAEARRAVAPPPGSRLGCAGWRASGRARATYAVCIAGRAGRGRARASRLGSAQRRFRPVLSCSSLVLD